MAETDVVVGDEELLALAHALGHHDVADTDQARVDQLEALERIKSAACATQARIAATMDTDRYEADPQVEESARVRSLGAQVALARHESPHRGRRLLGLATALVHDLPHTLAALTRGDINEHRAQIIATETTHLSREQRLIVDDELATRLARMGDRETQLAAQRLVMRIDEDGVLRRRAKALTRRRVTSRRLGDGMAADQRDRLRCPPRRDHELPDHPCEHAQGRWGRPE